MTCPVSFYDLERDVAGAKNPAERRPEIVARLRSPIEEFDKSAENYL
ncbi:MAG: hypothetical protein MI975_20260 [Cytophagales bacterium]|nr:hypothetical protein [Cytophagales bacterium]